MVNLALESCGVKVGWIASGSLSGRHLLNLMKETSGFRRARDAFTQRLTDIWIGGPDHDAGASILAYALFHADKPLHIL
jgi:hypothetical protein